MTSSLPPVPMPPPVPGMLTSPDGPASKQNNWQGVVGAITGVLGLGLFGVIFGALGLQSVKARTATNRGLALTGIIAGTAWMVIGVVVAIGLVALGWGAPRGSHFTAAPDLAVGDCFAKHGDAEKEGEFTVSGLYTMDCGASHYGEVYYLGTITASAYPGWDGVIALTDEACTGEVAAQNVDLDKAGNLDLFYIFPTSESWSSGDQTYVCMVTSEAEDLVGSVLLAP